MHGYPPNAGSCHSVCRLSAKGLYSYAQCAISLRSRWDGLSSSSCSLCLRARAEPVNSQPRFNNPRPITVSPSDRQQSNPVRANSNNHGRSVHWEWTKISIPVSPTPIDELPLFFSQFHSTGPSVAMRLFHSRREIGQAATASLVTRFARAMYSCWRSRIASVSAGSCKRMLFS